MNKIIKTIIIGLVFMIITGCSASVDININYNGETTENIKISNSNDEIKYGNKSVEDSIDLYLKKYDTALEVGNYNVDKQVGKTKSSVNISRSYNDVCSFINKTIFSQYIYIKIDCIETDDYYEIKSVGDVIKNTDRYDSWLAPDTVNVNLTLPVSAEEQNADEINGNTYIWKYDKDTTDKNFYLKINKESLKANEKKVEKQKKQKKVFKKVLIIVVIVVIIGILCFISKKLYKKYKENQLDY